MAKEKGLIDNMAATMSGLIRVCQALAKDRDERERGAGWRAELEEQLIEETQEHLISEDGLRSVDPLTLLLVVEGIRIGLSTNSKQWPVLRAVELN